MSNEEESIIFEEAIEQLEDNLSGFSNVSGAVTNGPYQIKPIKKVSE